MLAQELALQVENKKIAAFNAIEDYAASLRSVYSNALSEFEKQNMLLISQEADFAREIKYLTGANSDLLKSLEIETEDHKRSISYLQLRNAENEGLKKELDYSRKKNADLMDMVESLTQEIGQKTLSLNELQEKIAKLEVENETLAIKAQKLKEYVGKSASAYAQFSNDDALRRKPPPLLQESSTTTT